MKEITIIFKGLGYKDKMQANITIFDKNKKQITNTKTFNGKLKICLKEKQIYHLIAKSNNEIINTYIYINTNKYCFNFKRSIINNLITFLLKDYYYNLPIERGYLILWKSQ